MVVVDGGKCVHSLFDAQRIFTHKRDDLKEERKRRKNFSTYLLFPLTFDVRWEWKLESHV